MAGYAGGAVSAAETRLGGPSLRTARIVVGGVIALAVGGAVLGVIALVRGDRSVLTVDAPGEGAWSAPTSFGAVEAERLERTAAGAHASIHGGAPERVDRLTVTVTLHNVLDRAVPYSPGLLRLRRDATGTTITAVDPHPSSLRLAAGSTVHEEIAFLVPAGAGSFTLQFDDLKRRRAATIALGRVAGVPSGAER